ncbi:waprin-Phi3-like isoform X2 [Penaeus monodon]|uniref:waprin-Phi3-like isoform X2 n=1 Tax=Penaeus monodon TaxID=6687 RepID=UPI0018A7C2A7|nr:waprin-Phi3-like isoform X2 [Penaeus monodon]
MMTFRGMSVCVMCVAVMLTLTSTVQAGPTLQEKPGSCPFLLAPPPSLAGPLSLGGHADFPPDPETCRSDFDCVGRKKCCPTGACCGVICTDPVAPIDGF